METGTQNSQWFLVQASTDGTHFKAIKRMFAASNKPDQTIWWKLAKAINISHLFVLMQPETLMTLQAVPVTKIAVSVQQV